MDRWSSHIGFILAAIGAAVGIGNIWRFSAILGQNGGGAYLIPYFIAVFVFGLPLMILEITMGRRFRGTVVSSFGAVRPGFRFIGWLLCAIEFLILVIISSLPAGPLPSRSFPLRVIPQPFPVLPHRTSRYCMLSLRSC
jgi:SNF family Na+-dependent transporter